MPDKNEITVPFTTKNKLFTDIHTRTQLPGIFLRTGTVNKELIFTQNYRSIMPRIFLAALLLASATLTLTMCKKESTATYDCTTVTPTYNNDIKAIMNASCAITDCHDAANHQDGIDLSTYAKVKSESKNDRFLGSIQHLAGYQSMPDGASKLPDATIQKIYCWIENGQPE